MSRFELTPVAITEPSSDARPRDEMSKQRRVRRRVFDLDTFNENEKLVSALKQRVKSMDERKSQLEAFLRAARTNQWATKQEYDLLTNEFRQLVADSLTSPQGKELHHRLLQTEDQLKQMNNEVRQVREAAMELAKTCDTQRDAVQISQGDIEILRSRFLRSLPHVAGEVFLPEPPRQEQPAKPPSRTRPSGLLPLKAKQVPHASSVDLEIGACAIGRVIRKFVLRRALHAFFKSAPVLVIFAAQEISNFRKFLLKQGNVLPELATCPEFINIPHFLEIVSRTGYPTPGAVTAAFARGGLKVEKKLVIEALIFPGNSRPQTVRRNVRVETFDFGRELGT